MGKLELINGAKIHSTSDVSDKCEIGEGTYVWNNAQIRESAIIGKACIISKDVYIDTEVKIGNNVKVQNGVSVYKGVEIEDNVFLGPHMTFTNDLYPRAFNKDWVITPTLVKEGASIGAHATIVCGVIINEYAMVGSGSVVTKDIPAHALVFGNPARLKGFVCKCGHKMNYTKQVEENILLNCSKCNTELAVTEKNYRTIQ